MALAGMLMTLADITGSWKGVRVYGSAAALLHDIHLCFYICIAKRHFTEYLFFLSSDCYSVCIMYKNKDIF